MPPRPKDVALEKRSSKSLFGDKAVHARYAITLEREGKSATVHFEYPEAELPISWAVPSP